MRISAHDLRIEKDRYIYIVKKYIERTQRLCHHCLSHVSNYIEDETHFTVNCPLYDEQRKLLYDKATTFCTNFKELPNDKKYFWLFTNEHLPTLMCLRNYIIKGLEIRSRCKLNI